MTKIIFITGGATGIGRASVKKFLDEGWNVGFMDINAKEANNIFNETEEDLLEHRTDGTDAFDTLYIGCKKFPYRDSFSLSMSGFL